MTPAPAETRAAWMGVLARAPVADLVRLWGDFSADLGQDPPFAWLRRPETGMVMLRGRAGATGAPFNLGEMTVTRAALRLEAGAQNGAPGEAMGGAVGHAMVQGRSHDHARLAALADALLQTSAAPRLRAAVIDPLARAEAERRARRAAKAAATRVEFFTLVRGGG